MGSQISSQYLRPSLITFRIQVRSIFLQFLTQFMVTTQNRFQVNQINFLSLAVRPKSRIDAINLGVVLGIVERIERGLKNRYDVALSQTIGHALIYPKGIFGAIALLIGVIGSGQYEAQAGPKRAGVVVDQTERIFTGIPTGARVEHIQPTQQTIPFAILSVRIAEHDDANGQVFTLAQHKPTQNLFTNAKSNAQQDKAENDIKN